MLQSHLLPLCIVSALPGVAPGIDVHRMERSVLGAVRISGESAASGVVAEMG